jgi:dienelactone hydrolase
MSCDNRVAILLQRLLLALALVSSGAVSACGSDEPAGPKKDEPVDEDTETDTDNATEDDAVDEGDDGDGEPVTKKDSGTPPAKVDAGTKPPAAVDSGAKPATDTGTQPPAKTDGGDSTGGTDAGDSGGGTVDPPATGDGYIRGETPTADSASKKGPYAVKSYTSGYRNGPGFADATVYYPDDPAAKPPFAIVSVVPGFVSPQSSTQQWGPFLASHGIVTITIGTNSTSDQPPARAEALMDSLKTLAEENTREGSPIKGKLDLTRRATMGWSMGGGGSLLAAAANPDLKAAIGMAAWNPGYNYSKITVPTLMLCATGDTLAEGQSQGFYNSIPDTTKKMLYEVRGGGHSVANNPASQMGLMGRYGLSWMKVYLENDQRYLPILKLEKPSNASDFKTNL